MAVVYVQQDLDILNMALRRLGAEPLTDAFGIVFGAPGPSSKAGKMGVSYYENTVHEVLRILPFNVAVLRVAVTPEATIPADCATFAYKIPSILAVATDCVRILQVNADSNIPYRIEGDVLFCNEATMPQGLRYVKRVSAVKFDPILVECIVARLASKMCYGLTSEADVAQALYQEFALDLAIAKQISAVEDREDIIDLFGLYQNALIAMKRNSVSE